MKLSENQVTTIEQQIPRKYAELRAGNPSVHAVGLAVVQDPPAGKPDRKVEILVWPGATGTIPSTITFDVEGGLIMLDTEWKVSSPFDFAYCLKKRPALGGVCIAPLDSDRKGTLGGVVTRSGSLYIVSASHLLTKFGRLKPGAVILHPDTGPPIAKLEAGGPTWRIGDMDTDAAFAEVDPPTTADPVQVTHEIRGIGVPTALGKAVATMDVLVHGAMMSAPATARVGLTGETATIDGRYTFHNLFLTPRISKPGDSGALAVEVKGGAITIVGMLFAHNNQYSMYAHIADVVRVLKIEGWSWGW